MNKSLTDFLNFFEFPVGDEHVVGKMFSLPDKPRHIDFRHFNSKHLRILIDAHLEEVVATKFVNSYKIDVHLSMILIDYINITIEISPLFAPDYWTRLIFDSNVDIYSTKYISKRHLVLALIGSRALTYLEEQLRG